MESAQLPVDFPIGARPLPSRALTSQAPKGAGMYGLAHYSAKPDTVWAVGKQAQRHRVHGNGQKSKKSWQKRAHDAKREGTTPDEKPKSNQQGKKKPNGAATTAQM